MRSSLSAIRIRLEEPSLRRGRDFLAAVRRSRPLHRGLVTPPRTAEAFELYVARCRKPSHIGHLVCLPQGDLLGVVNVNEIVRGAFRSGYLGYYAFLPHIGCGYMTVALRRVVAKVFGKHRLHRLEANIQPGNVRSIALIQRIGFRFEGFSPRYLKVAGRWRDHERWALTTEDWRASRRASG